jgi:beta-glucosidase-like glycosyl hydrolase
MMDSERSAAAACLYQDPRQPIAARVRDLLKCMTLDEKIAQMHGVWMVLSEAGAHRLRPEDVPADGEAAFDWRQRLQSGLGQVTRALGTHGVDAGAGLRALNHLQRFLKHETRLGIPAISHEECLVGVMSRDCTPFPSALAFGATWNPALVERAAAQIGAECRALGCHQGLAPVLDVSRDLRWGRTEETFGEDPYLVGVLGTRYVRGLQGPRRDVLATLKHYVAHSFSEGGRNHATVNLGWRELNDTFLLPFEMVVKQARPGAVMPAYHDIDGEPSHASHHLLTTVLRDQWGFDGLVVADYGGINLLFQDHGVAQDKAQAAALAFNAGLDIELPGDDCARHVRSAIDRGQLGIDKIDEIVTRILTEKFRLGLFEHSFDDAAPHAPLRSAAACEAALEVARQSIVVLENNGILPLDPKAGQRIAVIGPTAADPMAQLSGYSFAAHVIMQGSVEAASHVVTPLQGLTELFGAAQLHYAQGCMILEQRVRGAPVFPGDVRDQAGVKPSSPVSRRTDLIPEAVAAAEAADVAIVFVGDLAGLFQTGTVGEGSDTDSLDLPGVQQELLRRIVATNTPTIVVQSGGRPYNLGGLESQLAASLMSFTGGQGGGTAIAEVLAGRTEPSGRLPVSVPVSAGATPVFYNHKLKSAGAPVAFHFAPRYPFGHGLAYTRFVYRKLELEFDAVDIETGAIVASFDVQNVGGRPGVAVAQLYVRDRHASVVRPVKELKAFARSTLGAGETLRLRFSVPTDMLCLTDHSGQRVVEPGWFDVMVGASSADLPLRGEVELIGSGTRTLGHTWRMESHAEEVSRSGRAADASSPTAAVQA